MNAEIDISGVVIKTERLTLRPWNSEDLDDFFEYASVEGVGEMAGWGHHRSKEESSAILERFIKGRRTFAIELKKEFACENGSGLEDFRGKAVGAELVSVTKSGLGKATEPGLGNATEPSCGKVIGSIGLEFFDESEFPEYSDLPSAELGFVLSKDYWKKGIMTEAVSAVIKYLFKEAGLGLLVCRHFTSNEGSAKVQEKCGFKPISVTNRPTQTGRFEKTVNNILTKEMWLSKQ